MCTGRYLEVIMHMQCAGTFLPHLQLVMTYLALQVEREASYRGSYWAHTIIGKGDGLHNYITTSDRVALPALTTQWLGGVPQDLVQVRATCHRCSRPMHPVPTACPLRNRTCRRCSRPIHPVPTACPLQNRTCRRCSRPSHPMPTACPLRNGPVLRRNPAIAAAVAAVGKERSKRTVQDCTHAGCQCVTIAIVHTYRT